MTVRSRTWLAALACAALVTACGRGGSSAGGTGPATPQTADTPREVDEKGRPLVPNLGLVDAPGHTLVVAHCIRCHGPKQFLQQRGDRETWLGLIRWMQRDHNLEELDPDVEDRIVSYLAEHYGPERQGRRPPLRDDLMPPNPYPASGG